MPHNCCRALTFQDSHSASVGKFHSAGALTHYAPSRVIEPVHEDITIQVDDIKSRSCRIKVETTFKGYGNLQSTAERSSISLNGIGFIDLKVTGDGVSSHYDGKIIQLVWKTPFKADTIRKVTIEYIVKDPVSGLFFSRDEETANHDDFVITDHETEKARYWLACVDYPAVRTTLTFHITAPERYISMANGKFEGDETHNGMKTTHWKLDYPCPSYLLAWAAGDLVEVDDGEVDGMPIKYYAAKSIRVEDLKRTFDITPKMVRWLQDKVGYKFPWPKYYQIALPSLQGAMEDISLVTWNDSSVMDETFAREFKPVIDDVNVHEMGHTYFGDLLVIRNFEHAWLKESWATYIECCWNEDQYGRDALEAKMLENANSYFEETKRYMRPIVSNRYDHSWDLFDMHLYPGGAWRIHMLRKMMGDEAFWTGVKDYVKRFATKTVQTADFQAALEETSGLNLTRFFEEWIHSKGYPTFTGSYNFSEQTNTLKISLEQTQVSHEVPLFGLTFEINVVDTKGQNHLLELVFDREQKVHAFLPLEKGVSPAYIELDPEMKLLFSISMSADESVLIKTASGAKNVFSRLWAYRELIKAGGANAMDNVEKLSVKERVGVCRAQVGDALATHRSARALQVLSTLMKAEQDPVAFWQLLANCRVRDPHVREALLEIIDRPDVAYRSLNLVLTALAVQRNPKDIELLLKIAKDDSKIGMHGLIRRGALQALCMHGSEETYSYAISRLEPGLEHFRAREGLVLSLKEGFDYQEKRLRKRTVDELETLLAHDDWRTRRAAFFTLVALNQTQLTDALEASLSTFSHDLLTPFQKGLKSLLSGEGGDVSEVKALKEQVAKLEERLKKLETAEVEKVAQRKAEKNE